jgi:YcfA-like protein.
VNKREKLLAKAQSGSELTYREFQVLMRQQGWRYADQNGSHAKWVSPSGTKLMIQEEKGKAKPYQVRQFLKHFSEEQ